MNSFEDRIRNVLQQAFGTDQNERVFIAAVSGGADSTAMLAGLSSLRGSLFFSLHCIHVEHGIRPCAESSGDALAVRKLCKKLKIPCRTAIIPRGKIADFAASKGSGIEAAARHFRRRIFAKERERLNADCVLTGHTKDDSLETILMRFLRGSGPGGLAVMPKRKGFLLRPLLDITRTELLEYLGERKIPYRTDSTNFDTSFLRNKIRLCLAPFLDEHFPSWKTSVLALGETQSLAANFIAEETAKRIPLIYSPAGKPKKQVAIREEDFLPAPAILKEEALFAAANLLANSRGTSPPPKRSSLRRYINEGTGGDLGPIRLARENGFIKIMHGRKLKVEKDFSMLIKEPGFYTLKEKFWGNPGWGDIFIKANFKMEESETKEAGGNCFAVNFPFVLRKHREGDRLFWGGHERRFSYIIKKNGISGIIAAVDSGGTAAFIALWDSGETKVIPRESGAHSENGTIKIFGSIDV